MDPHSLELARRSWPRLAKHLLRPLVETLGNGYQLCGRDTEVMLILLVISLRTAEHPQFESFSYEDLESGRIDSYPALGLNVRSIADSTGVPRETVRRKVAALVEAGLVERRDRGVRLTPGAARRLSGLRESVIRLAVAEHNALRGVLS